MITPTAEARALVTRRVRSSTLGGVGESVNMVVELVRTGDLVGDCVLFWHSRGQAFVGYALELIYAILRSESAARQAPG